MELGVRDVVQCVALVTVVAGGCLGQVALGGLFQPW